MACPLDPDDRNRVGGKVGVVWAVERYDHRQSTRSIAIASGMSGSIGIWLQDARRREVDVMMGLAREKQQQQREGSSRLIPIMMIPSPFIRHPAIPGSLT
jgi:hypothetical protein